MSQLTVADFFCGAGGFSEGFRQQGFKIVLGVDNWEPAIKTFNHNYGLNCSVKDIMSFSKSTTEIEALPDTDIILGSPPCVKFSSSNSAGKANKASGIALIKCFLRVVAIKKWKKGSKLKAWYMENVAGSADHLKDQYSFKDLGLTEWARINKIDENKIAIDLTSGKHIINAADYGSAQCRVRLVTGEIKKLKKLPLPTVTHGENPLGNLIPWRTLRNIKRDLPSPAARKKKFSVIDPNYPDLKVSSKKFSDHFYDTGLYRSEWKQSQFLKRNHPYMGRMSFPENERKPSRTITAMTIGTSREAIIYRSERRRSGDGQYRVPTVRESACLMGFPITYQFYGSENAKCKLVGNAVCPSVSRAFARDLRSSLKMRAKKKLSLSKTVDLKGINDLNTFAKKKYNSSPVRNKGAKFRRHAFKDGNITVTLSNYDINRKTKRAGKWRTSVQYGNGDGFPSFNVQDKLYRRIKPLVLRTSKGKDFLKIINNGFTEQIGDRVTLQEMFELQRSQTGLLEPTALVEKVGKVIDKLKVNGEGFVQKKLIVFKNKQEIPAKQLLALYAINKISTIANKD